MAKRFHAALLLILMLPLAVASASSGQERQDEDERRAAEEEISEEEKREALQIAERFVSGFEEQNDLLALIDALYVKDFEARLRPSLNDYAYLAEVEQEVIARSTSEDLRRFYAASLGFYYAGTMAYALNEYRKKGMWDGTSEGGNTRIDELLPPAAIAIMRTDPLLAQMIAEAEREYERAITGQSGEPEPKPVSNKIESLERMRSYTAALEKANALIREHLKTLSPPHTWRELMRAVAAREAAETGSVNKADDDTSLSVSFMNRDFFGFPKGTRLICLRVLCFHMDLVRVDGALKVLNVHMPSD